MLKVVVANIGEILVIFLFGRFLFSKNKKNVTKCSLKKNFVQSGEKSPKKKSLCPTNL
jgi:hypothetical protein